MTRNRTIFLFCTMLGLLLPIIVSEPPFSRHFVIGGIVGAVIGFVMLRLPGGRK